MNGKQIVSKCLEKGLSKWRISKIANVSWQTVHMWQKGTFNPTPKNCETILNYLDKTPEA